MTRRIPLAPREGWLTLGVVLLMCLTLAWSVDGVKWVLGNEEYLDYLVLAAAGGVLVAFVGAKVGWGRWLTYLIGSIFAALIVPILAAMVDAPAGATLHDLYTATAAASVGAFIDVVVRGDSSTVQFLHHVMIIGLIIWATSMFASYAVFGRHRALNAVIVVGVVLVGNMTFTDEDQLPLLVVFSLAALFLLIRSHVFDEQSEWLRRRIGDPASISSVYLRGGTTFIAVTVASAFILTQTASSAPLAGAWGGLGDGLLSLSRSVSKYFPTGGATRSVGLSFGSSSAVQQVWNNSDAVAVRIQRTATDKGNYYWRVVTFDRIDVRGWGQTASATRERGAGEQLLAGLGDDIAPTGRHSFTYIVNPESFNEGTILAPATPTQVDEKTRLTTVGQEGYFTKLERDGGNGPYSVTTLIAVPGSDPGQLNRAALLAAGTEYPSEIKSIYTTVSPGVWGPNLEALQAQVLDTAKSKAPVDIAEKLVETLRSTTYFYDTNVSNVNCGSMSTAECFATFKRGFCQWYAPTMAVVLRHLGIPARIVEGFLPGSREQSDATEVLRNNNAHAWVEAYFPGYGWVEFDPTGANLPTQSGPLPAGPADASLPPLPSFAAATIPPPGNLGDGGGPDLGPTGEGGPLAASTLGPLVAVMVLLLLVVAGVGFLAWQRGARGATTADAAYGMVTRIASRLGFGPRPAQTVYEYAGTLGEVLPDVKPELQTVARAKVESVYAREVLGADRLATVQAAQRRLRVSLLRLAFRRKERRGRRH